MNSDKLWLDPLYLDDLLSEEEKSIRKSAHDFCNKKLSDDLETLRSDRARALNI